MNGLKGAIRQLTTRPGLAAVIVLTLALGVGANAAMFSLFHQMLLQPLPVPEPERLVNLSDPGPRRGQVSTNTAGNSDQVFSYPMLRDLEREQTVFTGIGAHRAFGASIAAPGREAIAGEGMVVNGSYFHVLQLSPALGRLIGPQDESRVGEGRVVVLGYDYWRNNFGGDRSVLGRLLSVNGQSMTIIGVAPRGFTGTTLGQRPQVFVPLTMRWLMEPYFEDSSENRLAYWVYLFARLKPGVDVQQAENAINLPYRAIINDIEAPLNTGSDQFMTGFRGKSLSLKPGGRGQSSTPEDAAMPLTLLLAVTSLVLLIACVNIANLLLARGAARAGEMAVRASMGASRWQIVAQLLTEAAVLGLLGCLASIPLAAATLGVISTVMPAEVADGLQLGLSPAAILFAVAVSMVTVLLFGLFPALAATRAAPVEILKEQVGKQSGSRGMVRFRRLLATTQITFSMVLLVLAGLFIKSLSNLANVELGLRADPVATLMVAPVLSGYEPERSAQLFERIENDLATLPGVVSVASSLVPLIAGDSWGGNVSVQGFEAAPDADTNARYNSISDGFFATLEIPLLAGRDFTKADTAGRPRVAIVNETFARKFGYGADVVGKRMSVGAGGELDIEIVGLVKDAKYSDVKEDVPPQYFLARRQEEPGFLSFYVRSDLAPEEQLAAMAATVAALDPNLPVNNLSTLPGVVRGTLFLDRLIGLLSGGFAMLATLLAAIGLYGVLFYSVTQRMRELGLRQALGATPGRLLRMVLNQVGLMALVGGGAGLLLAVLLGRAAEALLFGLTGYDPAVLAAAVLVLGAVVFAAGFVPARYAARVDPLEALRHE